MKTPELRDMEVACDFCGLPGAPTWRYDVPEGTPLLTTFDRATGVLDQMRSSGAMGACDSCDEVLQSKLRELAPNRLAANMMRRVIFQRMAAGQRSRSKAAWAKCLRRIVPLLTNRRPNVHGSDPMDGKGVFFERSVDDPPETTSLN